MLDKLALIIVISASAYPGITMKERGDFNYERNPVKVWMQSKPETIKGIYERWKQPSF